MAIFRRREKEDRAANLDGLAALLRQAGLGRDTWTGKAVTPESALSGSVAVFACVSLLTDTMGSLPAILYRIDGDRRERVDLSGNDWPARMARMLHEQPNPEMTAMELWEVVEGALATHGNAYLNIVRDDDGRAAQLWPLRSDMMRCQRDPRTSERVYIYTLPSGERRTLSPQEVLHARTGVSLDGVLGLSPIAVARNAIALERAGGEYIGRYFANAAVPGGILTSPTALSKDREDALRTAFEAYHAGLSNAHRIAVLSGGVEWRQMGLPPKDAEFVALRKFQISEIARLYRVPPHMVGDVERSTSWGTGIEAQQINYVVHTVRPKAERLEQALNRSLVWPQTLRQQGFGVEFKVDHLLRGDIKARYEAYRVGIEAQFLLPNEARALENLPPIPGGDQPVLMPGQVVADERDALLEAVRALKPPVVKVNNLTPAQPSDR